MPGGYNKLLGREVLAKVATFCSLTRRGPSAEGEAHLHRQLGYKGPSDMCRFVAYCNADALLRAQSRHN